MKKLYNLLLLPVVALGILSCQDEVTRSDSPEFKEDAMQVYFTADNESKLDLLPTDSVFTVEIAREKTTEAATVKIKMSTANAECFKAPSEVSFAAGQAKATISVQIVKAPKAFESNFLEFSIEDAYTNPYVANAAGTPVLTVKVTITDWALYSVGTFYSSMFGASWEQPVMYSEIKNMYMFPDLYEEGMPLVIAIDKDGVISGETKDADGYYIFDAFVHSTYGLASGHLDGDPDYTGYVFGKKFISMDIKFTVAAGSFGWKTEQFVFGDDVDGIVGEKAAAE